MKLALVTAAREPAPAVDPERRGYSVVFRRDQVNHCPGCGRSQWHVGRSSAECAFCETAIPFAAGGRHGSGSPRLNPIERIDD